jgi:hypothetical protein
MNINFYKGCTIYEVNIRQYTLKGDIKSFINHIPRLSEMGIVVIWLMPIHPIGKLNRKGELGSPYSINDFNEIHPDYGTKEDFKHLVDIVHSFGMKIIMDWVANHTSWDHVWTQSNPEFYVRDGNGKFISPYDWTDVIQIDHENNYAHEALIKSMCYWVTNFNIDGFRADMAHLTPLHFWKKAKYKLELIKPDLIWLGETENKNYYEVFDVLYAWKWMHKSKEFIQNEISISQFIDFLKSDTKNPQLYFTSNHDENSWNGTEFEKYGRYAKAMSVFTFFYPYAVPLIYSGQEIPNEKRLSFFEKDAIDWNKPMDIFDFYKTISAQRKSFPLFSKIEFIDLGKKIISFKAYEDKHFILVFLNFEVDKITSEYQLPSNENGEYVDLFSSKKLIFSKNIKIELEPGEFLVLRFIE